MASLYFHISVVLPSDFYKANLWLPRAILNLGVLHLFEGISEHFRRSLNLLWTSFFYRICEADPLTAFGLVIWTNLVKKHNFLYHCCFKAPCMFSTLCSCDHILTVSKMVVKSFGGLVRMKPRLFFFC